MLNIFNKFKWFARKFYLFLLNPYLAYKYKFDFDFLHALKSNSNLIKENKFSYQPLSIDLVKKYDFKNENKKSYSGSYHLSKVINPEYFENMQTYGYGEKIIKATNFQEFEYLKSFHLYPANIFVINEILNLQEKKLINDGLIIDYPSGIGNLFIYLSKFIQNNLFYGVDNFEQISQKDILIYQESIGNIVEINTINFFYENRNFEKVDVLISIELNLDLIINDILKLKPGFIIFETFYISRFKHIKHKLSTSYKIYKINESIIIYEKLIK